MANSGISMSNPLVQLLGRTTEDLLEIARELDVDIPNPRWREARWHAGLATAIAHHESPPDAHYGCGVLEVHGEGFGFLRSMYDNLLPGGHDIYVSQSQIRRFHLLTGDTVIGRIRPPKEQERYPALLRVEAINNEQPDVEVTPFHEHTAVHPAVRLPLARDPWLQVVDWVAPLGLGHRGLLVGPARDARTEILRRLARAFSDDDSVEVTVLLCGDRPEEITAWREEARAEIIATSFDEPPARQLHVAEIAFERARRMAERGAEVLLIVDSLSRLFAACQAESQPRAGSGIDPSALQRLRRWLATGRDLRDAGSVTLVGTVNAGSDEPARALREALLELATWQVTLQANAHVPTDTRPAIDVLASWSRHEDVLVPVDELERRRRWRKELPDNAASHDEALASLFRPAALDSGTQAGQ